jgi:hypothetical protein
MRRLLFCILLSGFSAVYSQTSEPGHYYWISGGAGLYGSWQYFGISLYSSFNWLSIKIIDRDTITYSRNTLLEFRLIKNFASQNENTYENLTELGLLYGRSYGKKLQFKISGGIGLLAGFIESGQYTYNASHQPVYDHENVLAPGIPIEMGIRLVPSKNFGAGITGFANLNPKASMVGATFTLDFGNLYPDNRSSSASHESIVTEHKTSSETPKTGRGSFVAKHKTSIGLRGAYPFSYGLTIKRLTGSNRAIEGSLSIRKFYEYKRIYTVTMLFENEHKEDTGKGFGWFWGGGFHAGYGTATIKNGNMIFRHHQIFIGPDGVLGVEYSLDKIPFAVSLEVNPGIDLILHPWISGIMSVRYVF